MASFKLALRGNKASVRCRVEPEYYASQYELDRLRYCNNKNLMRCEYKKQELVYEGNGSRTVSQVIGAGVSYPQISGLIQQLSSLWSFTIANHLRFDRIVFHPDLAVVDQQTGIYQFMYYPVSGEAVSYNVGIFLLDLLKYTDMSDGLRRSWGEQLAAAANTQSNPDWGAVFGQMIGKQAIHPGAAYSESDEAPTGLEESPTGIEKDDEAPTGFDSGYDDEAPTGFDGGEDDEAPTGFDSIDEELTGFEDSGWNRASGNIGFPTLIRTSTYEKAVIKKNEFFIGRSHQRADFIISDNPRIGNAHAVILKENGRYYLKDNQSKNGTYVDGRRLLLNDRVELYDGQTFQLYDEEFIFNL